MAGTLQLPFPRLVLSQELLRNPSESFYRFVSRVGDEVIGELDPNTIPARPRTGHVGRTGMAVRDDWRNKGVDIALMRATLDLAENWLNLPASSWGSMWTTRQALPRTEGSASR